MMMPRLATIQPLANKVKTFAREESGVMAVQVLFFFFMMLLVGGVAVDLMRFEQRRVDLVQTMDRATLAAASLENVLVPEDVVTSYFEVSGLSEDLDSVKVTEALNSRTVEAFATTKSKNFFMSMVDVPYLESQSRSEAEQRITNVEIAMVLDVSGSMQVTPSRIANLKSAGQEFIDTVLENDTQNKISISIVPYNGQVNLGPTIFSRYNVTNTHGTANSFCIDLPTSTYTNTTVSRTTPFPQTPHVDSWSNSTYSNGYVALQGPTISNGRFSNMWCQPIAENFVTAHRNNKTALKAQIANLVAIGATSIDLGMKWGSMLLDPDSKPVIQHLYAQGQVPSYFNNRPAAYDDDETMKVIILMTDGENFTQERHGDAYRTGNSNIWRSTGDGMMSSFHDRPNTTNDYWVPHRNNGAGEWRNAPWNSGAGTTRLTWSQVWATARTNWVAWQLFARALGTDSATRNQQFTTWQNNFRGYTATNTMDSRLDQLCEVAKDNGIIVYGIAFEAPANGQAAIEDCASSPKSTFYFDASGLEIRTAFRLIASNISQLRLTQ